MRALDDKLGNWDSVEVIVSIDEMDGDGDGEFDPNVVLDTVADPLVISVDDCTADDDSTTEKDIVPEDSVDGDIDPDDVGVEVSVTSAVIVDEESEDGLGVVGAVYEGEDAAE